jgi:hypothetical protein
MVTGARADRLDHQVPGLILVLVAELLAGHATADGDRCTG